MFSKAIPLLFILAISVPPDLSAGVDRPETLVVDRVLATVDRQAITLSDVTKAILFYPFFRQPSESDEAFYQRVTEQLIDYHIILAEYGTDPEHRDIDVDGLLSACIRKHGSYDELTGILKNLDMSEADLRQFLRTKAHVDRILRERLTQSSLIPMEDIEAFYRDTYVPSQEELKIKPRSLVEMTPLIEIHLREERA